MSKLPNYIIAWVILIIIYAGLNAWEINALSRLLIGVVYWLWISYLIDKRGEMK